MALLTEASKRILLCLYKEQAHYLNALMANHPIPVRQEIKARIQQYVEELAKLYRQQPTVDHTTEAV